MTVVTVSTVSTVVTVVTVVTLGTVVTVVTVVTVASKKIGHNFFPLFLFIPWPCLSGKPWSSGHPVTLTSNEQTRTNMSAT